MVAASFILYWLKVIYPPDVIIGDVYFNMPYNEESTCNQQQNDIKTCDDICDNSNIRIKGYLRQNKVLYDNGNFVCKCWWW